MMVFPHAINQRELFQALRIRLPAYIERRNNLAEDDDNSNAAEFIAAEGRGQVEVDQAKYQIEEPCYYREGDRKSTIFSKVLTILLW